MFKIGKKLILTLAVIGAIFCLASCGKGEDVVRVKLEKDNFELIVNEQMELMPIVTKGGISTEANLGFKSYDESIATYVDGKITAIAPGETMVKVYDIDHPLAYATATVVVKLAESLNAKFSYETSMFKGEEQFINCELLLDSKSSIVSYKSANPDVATVDQDGKVVALSAGVATILAKVTSSVDSSQSRDYVLEITIVESDYKINYVLDGGVNNEANPAGFNVLELPLVLAEPTKKGYTFLGWYINDEKVEEIAAGTVGDITVVAKWEKATYYIQYELDGGQNAEVNLNEYFALDLPLTLQPATKTGYKFLGWYDGETLISEITEANLKDYTLVAKWEKEVYNLDLDTNGGQMISSADTSAAVVLQEFVITDYLAYNTGGYEACIQDKVSFGKFWNFITLKETEVKGVYQIVQIVAGSVKVTEPYDLVISYHSENKEDNKANLDAMLKNASKYVNQYVVLENVPTASTKEANITVKVLDATTVKFIGAPEKTYTIDDEVALPQLSKEGYNFLGWFDGETKVEKIEKGTTESMKLVAKFEVVEYTVEFNTDGGNALESMKYTVEKGIETLPTTTKEGYNFLGWYNGETKVEAIATGAMGDLTLTAKWEKITVKHSLEFVLNDGTCENLPTEYEEGVVLALPTPTKEGYKFLGWFANEECTGDAFTEISATANTDLKFYAAWEKIETPGPQPVETELVVDPTDPTAYKTIAEALAVATTGTVITVKAGTYEEVVSIDKEGIVLKGANAGVAYNGERAAETVVNQFVVTANAKNVIIDGFKFTGITAIEMNGGQNISIQNNIMGASATANGQAIISILAPVANLTVANNSFTASNPNNNSHYRAIMAGAAPASVDNAVIENNYFFTDSESKTYIDSVRIWSISGMINISNNTFDWPGNNFTTFLGGGTIADNTVIIHANNTYKGTKAMSGTSFRGLNNTTKVYYYGNTFDNVSGTVIEVRGSSADDSTTTIALDFKNNALLNTSTNIRFGLNKDTLTAGNNYYFQDVNYLATSPAEETKAETKEAALAGMKLVTVNYVCEQGTLNYVQTQIVDGVNYTLATALPVVAGYEFAGWYNNPEFAGEPVTTLNGATTLYAKFNRLVKMHNVSFVLNDGTCENLPTEYEEGVALALPTPTRVGYTFLGWFDNVECTGAAVTEISASANTDLTFWAQWEEIIVPVITELVVDPNDSAAYQTIDEAMNVANDGDVVIVKAGTYEGATITKSVTIKGANYGINPNTGTRVEETAFTKDLVIAASNVTVNGIKLTGEAKLVLKEDLSIENTTFENILVSESSLNASTLAPFYCVPKDNSHVVYSNIIIANSRIAAASTRAMIMYGSQVNGLTIENNEFYGTSASGQYNDGIKINVPNDKKQDFDICGNVVIKGNKFVNYCQYPVWLSQYAEGKYEFINNTFEGSALYTSYNDACFTMNTFKSNGGDGKVEVVVQYNTIKNSGILARIQTEKLTADNCSVKVNYNKVLNCLHSVYITDNGTNSANLIDATNNYYSKTPTAANFKGVSAWEPYYTDENDVPQYIEEGKSVQINYVLNGGTLSEKAPTEFNPDKGVQFLLDPTQDGMVFIGWEMNGKIVTEIPAGTTTDVTLVAKWREDAIYVGTSTEDWVLPTLAEAIAIAKPGDKIILLPGTYNENITIAIADLTIVGPNYGINPNTDTRQEEAVITGVITLDPSAINLTINGLAFTGAARIVSNSANANYSGFSFVYNKVYDTNELNEAWNFDRYKTTGFIEFRLASGGMTLNFTYKYNRFENVSATNILSNRANNLIVEGNTFKNFGRDAFRTAGGYVYGTLQFVDNIFEQDKVNTGYHAMYFKALAGPSATSVCTLVIKNNTFKNVGNADGADGPFRGTISSDFFQENPTDIYIENNIFDHCYNYLWLRNNGANETTKRWTCSVKNNQFLGLPNDYYFGTYRGNDSPSTNPHYEVFGENYYEDNDGNVITDLSQYADMFKHVKSTGTATSTKPGKGEVAILEFYKIFYDVQDGSIRGSYETGYTNMLSTDIKLPTAVKTNHDFLGWMLNGEIITVIPASTRGDIKLVAQWQKQEGELYDVTYNYDGGYSEALLVQNHGDAPTLPLNNFDYNGGTFWGGKYTTDIFISTASCDPAATFSDRIYIGKNSETGLYEVLSVISSGASSWAEGAEYVITISNSYQGSLGGYWGSINPITKRISVGQMVAFDKAIDSTSNDSPTNVYFFDAKPEGDILTVQHRYTDRISTASQLGFKFLGWYDAEGNKWESLEKLTGALTLTAKWEQLNPVTSIKVDAICDKLLTGDTFQIVASVQPDDAYFKQLSYVSSNTDILTVDANGKITAINAGKATITIWDYLKKVKYEKEITVNAITSIDVQFAEEFDGVLAPTETIQLVAKAFGENTANAIFTYTSSDEKVLTVSETGLVTAVADGTANVTITMVGTDKTFVLPMVVKTLSQETEIDKLLALLVENNKALVQAGNISLYNDGVERVYVSTYGSVNRLLFDKFEVNEDYYATTEANPNNHKNRRDVDTIQFVTVHDTATLTGTVVSIAQGMSSGTTSIHYTVGNDAVYGVVPEKYIAYHAGDGTDAIFTWTKTNVKATGNIAPKFEVVLVGETTYLALNGETTNIVIPQKERGGVKSNATTADLSHLGPVWRVEDGYYYIGEPLWYSVSYDTVGSRGGNTNSIGIEMCSNLSGDIYDTFQRTARLVADILIRNNLDTTRVKMHNTWSGKNCPQTMISGNFWGEFMEMVDLQYEVNTTYKDATITMTSNNPDIIDNTGRVVNAPATTTVVSYTLTVTLGSETRSITLYNVVPGTTTWEQWDGTYSAKVIWNEGNFSIN